MLQVCFDCYGSYTTDSVYQWDLNRRLTIRGLDYASAPTIHFSNKKSKEALVVQSTIEDGVIYCDVPNILLQEPYDIIGYVCESLDQELTTYETIRIPVKARVKPADYVYEDNVEILTYYSLMSEITSVKASTEKDLNDMYVKKANVEDVRKVKDDLQLEIEGEINKVETEITVERSRIDQLIHIPAGATTGDVELMDVRVDVNGNTHESAGTAVRVQISEVKAENVENFNYLQSETDAKKGKVEEWFITGNIKAVLYKDGTFAFLGKGRMPIFEDGDNVPWCKREYLSQIKHIYFDNRLEIPSLYKYFYLEGNPVADVEMRVDIPNTTQFLGFYCFNGVNLRHLNLAKLKDAVLPLESFECILENNTTHCIYSIPASVCSESVIAMICDRISAVYSGTKYSVGLFITDSVPLKNAIYTTLDNVNSYAKSNIGVICCTELGPDGFPINWTSYMKKAYFETIKYIGRHREITRTPNGDNYDYWAYGMTGLSSYDSMGIPSVFDVDATCRLRGYEEGVGKVTIREVNMSDYFSGKPMSSAIETLGNGLSCAGFVDWLYWRYFNEHFGLSSVIHFMNGRSPYNNRLPLSEIAFYELKPFDILVKYASDGSGHVAIFMGYDVDGKARVIESAGGYGLTFGRWNETDTDYEYKYYKFTKSGISSGMLIRE